MAIKTLVRVTSSPSVISEQEPMLSSIILQLILQRLESASSHPLPLPLPNPTVEPSEPVNPSSPSLGSPPFHLTEQAVLVLTLIDALPYLRLDLLEEWLNIAAASIKTHIADNDEGERLKQICRERFWLRFASRGGLPRGGGVLLWTV